MQSPLLFVRLSGVSSAMAVDGTDHHLIRCTVRRTGIDVIGIDVRHHRTVRIRGSKQLKTNISKPPQILSKYFQGTSVKDRYIGNPNDDDD